MARLSTIVSSILHGFIQAQHEANCYSLSLGREYGQEGRIREFQLPNAIIGDLEFELKYAVKGEGEQQEVYDIDYPKLHRFFKEFSAQLAKISVTSIVSSVSAASIGAEDGYEHFHQFMRKEETLKREFCAFLSRKIKGMLTERTAEIIPDGRQPDEDVLLKSVDDVVRTEFLQHPDLEELFSGKAGENLKAEAEENLKHALKGLMGKLLNDFDCVRKHVYPSIEVEVTAEELKKLPEEAVQCIRFKIVQQEVNERLKGEMKD